jgi:hypothetical protein
MLDGCIDDQRHAIRYFILFAAALAVLGLCVVTVTLLFTRELVPDTFKSFLATGGGFVATLSTFPLKEVLTRREKERALILLRARLLALTDSGDAAAAAERTQIKAVLWKLVEKTAVG